MTATIEVRPMTNEDERFYRDVLGGTGALPVFVAEYDGAQGYGNSLAEAGENCLGALEHRRVNWGIVGSAP